MPAILCALISLMLSMPALASPPCTVEKGTAPMYGQKVMVLVPNASSAHPYQPSTPTPLIIYCHGAGETERGLLDDGHKTACVAAFLNAGFILAGSAAHGVSNWGNPASVEDYADLYDYVSQRYHISKVLLWSQSMGGLDGLLTLSANKVPNIAGWLGTYPVCNLSNLYTLGKYAHVIDAAYGITGSGTATYASMTFGSDPALKWGNAFRNVPMRFYASYGDLVVPRAQNTDVLASLVAQSTREASVVACKGNHGDPSHFQPSDYLAFFRRCLDSPVPTSGGIALPRNATAVH